MGSVVGSNGEPGRDDESQRGDGGNGEYMRFMGAKRTCLPGIVRASSVGGDGSEGAEKNNGDYT
jgi:hypothetical protein